MVTRWPYHLWSDGPMTLQFDSHCENLSTNKYVIILIYPIIYFWGRGGVHIVGHKSRAGSMRDARTLPCSFGKASRCLSKGCRLFVGRFWSVSLFFSIVLVQCSLSEVGDKFDEHDTWQNTTLESLLVKFQ